jgi:hypothetical protein
MSLLLDGFFTKVVKEVAENYRVEFFTAIVLVLIAFFRRQVSNLTAVFASVPVHGNWTTILETPQGKKADQVSGTEGDHGRQPPATAHEDVTLYQFFNKVWGNSIVQSGSNPVYKLRGQLVGEKLSLLFRAQGDFDSGAIFLEVLPGGRMVGYEVGFTPEGNIYSDVYRWKKRAGTRA